MKVLVVDWLSFITVTSVRRGGEKGGADGVLTACWQCIPPPSLPSLPCLRVRYKCAGGRKLGLDPMKLLAQTGEQKERKTFRQRQTDVSDTTHQATLMNLTAMLVFKSCLGKLV